MRRTPSRWGTYRAARRQARRGTVFGAAVGLALATVGLAAPPASAVTACPNGRFCFWIDGGFTGAMSYVTDTTRLSGSWDNSISSFTNSTSTTVYLLDDAGVAFSWTGHIEVPPGTSFAVIPDFVYQGPMGSYTYNANDRVSEIRFGMG